jgi:tetratricopeptide (TPR) repeat protein
LLRSCVFFFVVLLFFVSACGANTKEELYAEGVAQLEQGNPQGSIVAFRNALEKDQNFFQARFQLAKAYLELNRFELADQELRKVRLQNPSHPGVALEMGRALLLADKLPEAREEILAYLQNNPDSPEALLVLGEIYGREANYEQAGKTFQQVLAHTPDEPEANVGLAKIALIQGQLEQARAFLDSALARVPEHLEALHLLADIQQRQSDPDGLLETFTTITRITPQDVNTLYRLGMIHLDKGDLEKVDEIGRGLREQHPRRAEGFSLQGLINFREQNFPEAINALQQANSIQPSLENHFYLGVTASLNRTPLCRFSIEPIIQRLAVKHFFL